MDRLNLVLMKISKYIAILLARIAELELILSLDLSPTERKLWFVLSEDRAIPATSIRGRIDITNISQTANRINKKLAKAEDNRRITCENNRFFIELKNPLESDDTSG